MIKENSETEGKFKITYLNSKGEVIHVTDWQENLVVSSNGYGRNLIARQLAGIIATPISITQLALSTNATAPSVADNTLGGTQFNTDVQFITVSTVGQANVIDFSGFFTDADLPNNTYNKIGVKMGNLLLTSALLDTPIVKDTGENFRIDYKINLN
jgi:hypothetical protein